LIQERCGWYKCLYVLPPGKEETGKDEYLSWVDPPHRPATQTQFLAPLLPAGWWNKKELFHEHWMSPDKGFSSLSVRCLSLLLGFAQPTTVENASNRTRPAQTPPKLGYASWFGLGGSKLVQLVWPWGK